MAEREGEKSIPTEYPYILSKTGVFAARVSASADCKECKGDGIAKRYRRRAVLCACAVEKIEAGRFITLEEGAAQRHVAFLTPTHCGRLAALGERAVERVVEVVLRADESGLDTQAEVEKTLAELSQ